MFRIQMFSPCLPLSHFVHGDHHFSPRVFIPVTSMLSLASLCILSTATIPHPSGGVKLFMFLFDQSIPMAFCVLRIKVKVVVEISKILYFISTSPSNLSLSHPLPAPCWIPCASHQLHICSTTFTLPSTAAVVLDPQVACVSYSLPLLVLTCPLYLKAFLDPQLPSPRFTFHTDF